RMNHASRSRGGMSRVFLSPAPKPNFSAPSGPSGANKEVIGPSGASREENKEERTGVSRVFGQNLW
ncbi:MAG: hypothetical protein POH28_06045, partial [Acidocella sp.]|nr:hypothetical protein [Acidocella sp.]